MKREVCLPMLGISSLKSQIWVGQFTFFAIDQKAGIVGNGNHWMWILTGTFAAIVEAKTSKSICCGPHLQNVFFHDLKSRFFGVKIQMCNNTVWYMNSPLLETIWTRWTRTRIWLHDNLMKMMLWMSCLSKLKCWSYA